MDSGDGSSAMAGSFQHQYSSSSSAAGLVEGNNEQEDSLGAGSEDGGESEDGHGRRKQYVALREQDRFLPIANVARIMKLSIPKTGKIAKDAKECVQECVSEFVSFITSEASDRCHQVSCCCCLSARE